MAIAAPGAIVLGIVLAKASRLLMPFASGTLGGNLLEFVMSFGVWLIADHLGLSPVLCLVAFAMTLARTASLSTRPRMRIHSFAVWDTTVFLLNVFAFLLMGLQARTIVQAMARERLRAAAWFALAVIGGLIVVRMAWVLLYNRLAFHFRALRSGSSPATLRQGVLVGWCGMRGLVTLATAFALPAAFPQRDLIVLTAFAVVLATLVVQGLTLAPLVRLLKLDGDDGLSTELADIRAELAATALTALEGKAGPIADHWRYAFALDGGVTTAGGAHDSAAARRALGLCAVRAQRQRLDRLRREQRVGADAFLLLQEELDFAETALASEHDRHIEES